MKINPVILFKKAYGKFCIPAINISSPEQIHGLFSTAQKLNAPFIIQTTPAAREYMNPIMLVNCIKSATKIYPNVVFAMHLDHGNEPHINNAIDSGEYTSVMIDASHDPLEKNIERTKLVVDQAHQKNIAVEAELGVLSGIEDHLNIEEENALYTNPADVEYFVKKTHCDSLAVAIGTSHGAYKFSGGKGLRLDLLEDIQKRVPNFPIVLHGASSIDIEEIKRINIAGGNIKEDAKGITEDEIRKAISYGVCKLNIATDLRILWIRIFREYFQDSPEHLDPLKAGRQYMEELEVLLTKKFEILGNINKSALYK
ncbi:MULTISPECIES: class II fructose-bisphosphate aldolase [Chryseobacterium]|uniref:class II fructose-bisphosphate aldolase n=1 Tax=Chryseobacterium TaxID=59732 RepID=UPI001BE88BAD|nr:MULTISPECIES: class II fructose-bisphosphate aldolase [Chryseobacterium]MBT2620928.1 class II fructose-bisphosphate aldolase [Chryseobacterium sp. ISL-6]